MDINKSPEPSEGSTLCDDNSTTSADDTTESYGGFVVYNDDADDNNPVGSGVEEEKALLATIHDQIMEPAVGDTDVRTEPDEFLNIQLGATLVTLNSVFSLYNELSVHTAFMAQHLSKTRRSDSSSRYIGSQDPSEGFVKEKRFIKHYASHGYEVTISCIDELSRHHRVDSNGFTTFLVQGIAERTTKKFYKQERSPKHPLGMKFTKGWRQGVSYMFTEDPKQVLDTTEANNQWMHCIHVVPFLDRFYCSGQRSEDGDLVACPFAWLLINHKTAVLEPTGYLRNITYVWKVVIKKENVVSRVKRK